MKKSISILTLFFVLFVSQMGMAQQSSSQQLGDYHLSLYYDAQDDVLDLEAYTKHESQNAFFGVTCSVMSPFPSVQVLLFDEAAISASPRLLKVSYQIDGQPGTLPLQAVLQAEKGTQGLQNQLRLEVDQSRIEKNLRRMQQIYTQLLEALESGQSVQLSFQHRTLGQHDYLFSLNGFKALIEPHREVCR
ncbi:MAG: hypothetical protein JXR44_09365 [Thiotrichales bacterium]|nr:hypothetical protein [Thiotrichales bacterium]